MFYPSAPTPFTPSPSPSPSSPLHSTSIYAVSDPDTNRIVSDGALVEPTTTMTTIKEAIDEIKCGVTELRAEFEASLKEDHVEFEARKLFAERESQLRAQIWQSLQYMNHNSTEVNLMDEDSSTVENSSNPEDSELVSHSVQPTLNSTNESIILPMVDAVDSVEIGNGFQFDIIVPTKLCKFANADLVMDLVLESSSRYLNDDLKLCTPYVRRNTSLDLMVLKPPWKPPDLDLICALRSEVSVSSYLRFEMFNGFANGMGVITWTWPLLQCALVPDLGKNGSGSEEFSVGLIAGGLVDGNIELWNPLNLLNSEASKSALDGHLSRHKGPVHGLEFNVSAPHLIASGAVEIEVHIWDLAKPTEPSHFPPLEGSVSAAKCEISFLSWSSKVQHILASTSYNETTVAWDLTKQKPFISFSDQNRMRCSVLQWNPEVATQLFVTSYDDASPSLRLWDMRNIISPVKEFVGHTKGVIGMSWCPIDNSYLLTCAKDNRTICWDTTFAEIVWELPSGKNGNSDAHWYPKVPGVISASSFARKIGLYNIEGCIRYGVGNIEFLPAPIRAPKWYKRPADVSFRFGEKPTISSKEPRRVEAWKATIPLRRNRKWKCNLVSYNQQIGFTKKQRMENILWRKINLTHGKKDKELISRWFTYMYKLDEENMLKFMKETGDNLEMLGLREKLNNEKVVGNIGLLDHLMKHMTVHVVLEAAEIVLIHEFMPNSSRDQFSSVASKHFEHACIPGCPTNPSNFNVDNVCVAKLSCGGLHNNTIVRGMVLNNDIVGSIKNVEKAVVAVFVDGVDTFATETEGTILIHNVEQLENYAKTEKANVQLDRFVKDPYAMMIVLAPQLIDIASPSWFKPVWLLNANEHTFMGAQQAAIEDMIKQMQRMDAKEATNFTSQDMVIGLFLVCIDNIYWFFALPRPPEIIDLEDKVIFKGGGMLHAIIRRTSESSKNFRDFIIINHSHASYIYSNKLKRGRRPTSLPPPEKASPVRSP